MKLSRASLLLLLCIATACGGESGGATQASDGTLDEPRRKAPPYQAGPVTSAGSITGTVTLAAAPAAPAAPGSADAAGATAAASAAQAPAPQQANAAPPGCPAAPASDIVVYLEDIARGRPLAADTPRRYEIAAEKCVIEPAVQVAAAGGTLNVSNAVGRVHYLSFLFEGMRSPLLRIPFSDPGQLVPTEVVLETPGLVHVTGDHAPGVAAQIVVVEHPYAVTAAGGSFTLDSVPPGTYSIVAVNGAGRRATARVTVQAGSATTTALTLQ